MNIRNLVRRPVILILALALFIPITPIPISAADAAWSAIPMPLGGGSGGWGLAPNTDVSQLATDNQGRLYAWVTGTEGGLFRQNDNGFTRLYSSAHLATALKVAADGKIYYAITSTVYRSTDGGQSFLALGNNPGGAGANNRRITGMSVVAGKGSNGLAVSVADDDTGQWGGIYVFDEADFFGGWRDTGMGSYDALDVVFSPNYAVDRLILALAADGVNTFVLGHDGGWQGISAAALKHGSAGLVARNGKLAPTPDFNFTTGAGRVYAAASTGVGGGGAWLVYPQRLPQGSVTAELPVTGDFSSLAVGGGTGAYTVLAGSASTGKVFTSADSGFTWQQATIGGERTTSITAAGGKFYAATSGIGSAISASDDGGKSWGQSSFIDGYISSVVDMVVSPRQDDGALYLLTFGDGHNLWRTQDDGVSWRRILRAGDYSLVTIDRLGVAADGTLYVAGETGAGGVCLKSTDSGQSFSLLPLPVAVDSTAGFAAADGQRFFYTSFDGNQARVWRTLNGVFFENTAVGAVAITALELSPNFAQDNTLLAAASDGKIYLSTDGGVIFTALPASGLTGDLYLAFANDFASSRNIYAASRAAGAGVWRLKIGESAWSRVDSGLPAGTIVSGLLVSGDGILYASSANQVNASSGGLVRKTLDYNSWDMARGGLPDGATLWGLGQRGNKLYSLDTTNNHIMTYTDTLASPVELVSPVAGAPALGTYNSGAVGGIDLVWRDLPGASAYQWQVNDSADMTSPRFEGTTAAETVRLNNLDPGATYYWRVRATSPLPGPWSAKRSFTTALGSPLLLSPVPGATGVSALPPFQWQPVSGATGYELMLSIDAGFQTLAASPTGVTGNVWQPQAALAPATTYFWKVRAVSQNSLSAWSAVSVFITAAPPPIATTTPPTPPTTTAAAPASFGQVVVNTTVPDWLIYTLIGMGGLIIILLIVVIAFTRSRRM